jgi:diguanylate cyclase (GGDEF)-like protein
VPDRASAIGAAKVAIGGVVFGGTALAILHDWLGIGGDSLGVVVEPIYGAVVLAAALACLIRAAAGAEERAAWLAATGALLAWSAAELYWRAAIEGDPSPPYPSPADIGYLGFYPLAALALVLLIRARAEDLDWRLWMDGLIAGLGTSALGAALVFEFVAERTSGSTLEVAITLAYPLLDVLMLGLLIGVIGLTRWRPGRTWTLLALGVAAIVAADIAYTVEAAGEVGMPSSAWIEPLYLLGAVFVAAEALHRSASPIRAGTRVDGWRELVVPGTFAAVMIGLVAIQYFGRAGALTTVLWTATMLAVIARLALSVRENQRLVEQTRTDRLTGLGSRARLEVDLDDVCLHAAARPATLLLLDLNGFKQYNDNFGHPAGDAMLRRLGARLGETVGAEDVAYRMGGDEFAVLVRGPRERALELAKRAAEALTERGEGFELGAAWGAASIPVEAEDAEAAVELADVRMYAQKESRRLARAEAGTGSSTITVRSERAGGRESLEQGN